VYGQVPDACVVRVFASDLGIAKNDIDVRSVPQKVVHSVIVTTFQHRRRKYGTHKENEHSNQDDPLHQVDFAPAKLVRAKSIVEIRR
jgi:hypothetical protein